MTTAEAAAAYANSADTIRDTTTQSDPTAHSIATYRDLQRKFRFQEQHSHNEPLPRTSDDQAGDDASSAAPRIMRYIRTSRRLTASQAIDQHITLKPLLGGSRTRKAVPNTAEPLISSTVLIGNAILPSYSPTGLGIDSETPTGPIIVLKLPAVTPNRLRNTNRTDHCP
jgi:hypothetical protein